ncbi:cytochrome b5 domain-containing protein [Saccharospirillum impatiens]|uniref:cytochrome b5 domain-containing protein n=1 Tax=Saccharospirillum impatiens TaxID=169438 RepID=UPI0004036BA4|nr:cytochrome b5 domain-containing protein [Saccharospirillum impatiens]
MNKFAYSALIAFVSSLLTLIAVVWVAPTVAESDARVREITLDELATHNSADSCWKEIEGLVYDVTDFIDRHPTPASVMTQWCGRPSTEGWVDKGNGRPHSQGAEALLDDFLVGYLEGADVDLAALNQSINEAAVDASERTATGTEGQGVRYRDGSYYAEAEPGSRGTFGIIEISVQGNRIVGVYFDEFARDEDGTVNYRKSADMNYAERWRRVSGGVTQLSTYPAYERMLIEQGVPEGVDAISGATGAHEAFVGLAAQALSDAR